MMIHLIDDDEPFQLQRLVRRVRCTMTSSQWEVGCSTPFLLLPTVAFLSTIIGNRVVCLENVSA